MAADRLEAWKGSVTRAGALRALEFAKAWYLNLDLTQLATFRQEAGLELAAAGPELTRRAAVLADYTNLSSLSPTWMLTAMR